MIDRTVKYLGLTLKNPIVVSSCGLTSTVDGIKKLEDAGVAAVVLKSLFEEQIAFEAHSTISADDGVDMESYINTYVKENRVGDYLKLIQQSKSECSIPIIASICCSRDGDWSEYARDIEKAGADALELNIFHIPTSEDESSAAIEANYIKIAQHVVESLSIPVVVKIPDNFTNPFTVINQLYYRGVKGIVMFNRFYQPDIDVEQMKIISSSIYSSPQDICKAIRWIGLVSSKIKTISYGSSTGVYGKEDVVKMILAGANVVHICSVLYKNGNGIVKEMLDYLDVWADKHTFSRVEDFRGLLDASHVEHGEIYERAQFMRYFSSNKV